MAYSVCVTCDVCGSGYQWEDHSVSYSTAVRIARKAGWSIGKRGWRCPRCQKKKLLPKVKNTIWRISNV